MIIHPVYYPLSSFEACKKETKATKDVFFFPFFLLFYTPRGMVCWLEPTHPFTCDLGKREVQVVVAPSFSDGPMPSKCRFKLVRSNDHMCESLFFF